MYQQSPMENFNKNNPFIVMSKRKYDKILDDIQAFGANCIRGTIINIVIWVIGAVFCGIYIYKSSNYILPIAVFIILALINIAIVYMYRQKIAYYISHHPNMREFDRISSLEVNNILVLNNEDVLKCLQGLYELHGELTTDIKYYQVFLKLYSLIEIVFSIIIALQIIY